MLDEHRRIGSKFCTFQGDHTMVVNEKIFGSINTVND